MTAEQTHMHRPAGLLTAVLWPFISWWMGGKIRAKRRALFGGYFGSWSCLMEDTYTFLCGEIWALLLCVMKQLIFLYLLCPAIRFFASFPPSLLLRDVSITFSLAHSFSLFQLFYSHLLIFTSSCLSLSLNTTICCLPTPSQHISISLFSSITSSAMFSFNHPLKKCIHLWTTGLLLDHVLCCYSCYHGLILCCQGGQGLPCKQSTSGNAHRKNSKDAYCRR